MGNIDSPLPPDIRRILDYRTAHDKLGLETLWRQVINDLRLGIPRIIALDQLPAGDGAFAGQLPIARSAINTLLVLPDPKSPTYPAAAGIAYAAFNDLLYTHYIHDGQNPEGTTAHIAQRRQGLPRGQESRKRAEARQIAKAIKLWREVYEKTELKPDQVIAHLRGTSIEALGEYGHDEIFRRMVLKNGLRIVIPATLGVIAAVGGGALAETHLNFGGLIDPNILHTVAACLCLPSTAGVTGILNWKLLNQIFDDPEVMRRELQDRARAVIDTDYAAMRPHLRTHFAIHERVWMKQNNPYPIDSPTDPSQLSLDHLKNTQAIVQKLMAHSEIPDEAKKGAYAALMVADFTADEAQDLLIKVGGNGEMPLSEMLYNVAAFELIRRNNVPVTKDNLAGQTPILDPILFPKFVEFVGKNRGEGVKMFGDSDPPQALSILAPASIDIHCPDFIIGNNALVRQTYDGMDFGDADENTGTTGLLPAATWHWWNVMYARNLAVTKGSDGTKVGIVPSRKSYDSSTLLRMAKAAETGKVVGLRSWGTQMNEHSLYTQFLCTLAALSQEHRSKARGMVKHSTNALTRRMAIGDYPLGESLTLLAVLRGGELVGKAVQNLYDINDPADPNKRVDDMEHGLRNSRELQAHLVAKIISSLVGKHTANKVQLITGNETPSELYKDLYFAVKWIARETPDMLRYPDRSPLTNVPQDIVSLLSESGEQGTGSTKSIGLVFTLYFLNEILTPAFDDKKNILERNSVGIQTQHPKVVELRTAVQDLAFQIAEDTLVNNLGLRTRNNILTSEEYLNDNVNVFKCLMFIPFEDKIQLGHQMLVQVESIRKATRRLAEAQAAAIYRGIPVDIKQFLNPTAAEYLFTAAEYLCDSLEKDVKAGRQYPQPDIFSCQMLRQRIESVQQTLVETGTIVARTMNTRTMNTRTVHQSRPNGKPTTGTANGAPRTGTYDE